MTATRNGIYHELNDSPYILNIKGYDFYFSSELNYNRFKNTYKKEILEVSNSLTKRFKIYIDATLIGLIRAYERIEIRGFLIKYEGEEICRQNLKLDIVDKTN